MYEVWKNQHKTIADSGFLIRGLFTNLCSRTETIYFTYVFHFYYNITRGEKYVCCRFRSSGEEADSVGVQSFAGIYCQGQD